MSGGATQQNRFEKARPTLAAMGFRLESEDEDAIERIEKLKRGQHKDKKEEPKTGKNPTSGRLSKLRDWLKETTAHVVRKS